MKAYRVEAILSPLFKLCEACMELFVPLVVAMIVDVGIATGDVTYIVTRCLILVAFGVAGLAFALTAQFFAAKAAVGASAELRRRLFNKLQSLSYTQIDDMGTATMITRMTSDVNQVQAGVNMTLRLLLRSPIVVLGATVMAFVVDWQAALVFVAVTPLLAAAVVGIMCATVPMYRRVQGSMDGVYLATRENLAGVRVIRAFCKEQDEEREFAARNASLRREQKRAGRIAALTNPLTYTLVSVAAIALVWVGAIRVDGGFILQGDVVALYSYLSIILVELVKFANLIFTASKAISCEKRIEAVLELEGEPSVLAPARDGWSADAPAFSFEDVTFAYHGGGAPAIHNITFSARRGETVGILGGTGSGKTTLISLLPRFYPASRGTVRLGGRDVSAIPAEELRERVGVVPQKAVLFKGTVRSNLLWGRGDAADEELMRAARIAQAEDVIAAKGGLDGEIAQEGRNLSGGQRQRLTIARALVRRPEVLILDDSSSALDYATDARLRKALAALDMTVIVVSQRTASVRHADKIVVLDDGGVAGIGTHDELMERCELYREIAASQEKEGTL
ncbi:MAG TPA: ABC transporter ATP-binding protein/permease [Firmicutes bacterium]|nr:ABC transporter ATP-binding protein/permease [Bacillota bacterium]